MFQAEVAGMSFPKAPKTRQQVLRKEISAQMTSYFGTLAGVLEGQAPQDLRTISSCTTNLSTKRESPDVGVTDG